LVEHGVHVTIPGCWLLDARSDVALDALDVNRAVEQDLAEDHDHRHAGALPEAHVSTDRRIALLLEVFDQAFDRRAWHGTALWGSIGDSHRASVVAAHTSPSQHLGNRAAHRLLEVHACAAA